MANKKAENIIGLKHHNTEKYSTGNDLHSCSIFHPEYLQTPQRSHHSFLQSCHLPGEGEKNRLERYGEERLLKSRERGRIGKPSFQECFTKHPPQKQVMALC